MVAKMLTCICVWVAIMYFVDAEQYFSVYDRRGFPLAISSGSSHSEMRLTLAEESDRESLRGRVDMSRECKVRQRNFFGPGSTIVSGEKVEYPEHYPFMVSLHKENKHGGWNFACGAVIVARRWILTAAHCLIAKGAKRTIGRSRCTTNEGQAVECYVHARQVKFGYVTQQGLQAALMAEKLYPYEKYRVDKHDHSYDIALVKLNAEIPEDKYVPICLSEGSRMDYSKRKAPLLIGWGRTNPRAGLSKSLMQTYMYILPREECRSSHVPPSTILCAKSLKSASCQGDSGGPLFVRRKGRYYLLGVVNTGLRGCRKNTQTTFARVSKYRNWITKRIERKD